MDPVRDLRFYNQGASVNSSPSFTPDGKQIVYSSSAPGAAAGSSSRIWMGAAFGRSRRSVPSIPSRRSIRKPAADLVFSSGRSGPEQIYRMNMDGADVERLSEGTGEAANPSWHPDGQLIAFAWTRGFAAGAWNIFVMDVASRKVLDAVDAWRRQERASELGARREASRLSVDPRRTSADLFHAGGRNAGAAVDHARHQRQAGVGKVNENSGGEVHVQ